MRATTADWRMANAHDFTKSLSTSPDDHMACPTCDQEERRQDRKTVVGKVRVPSPYRKP